MKLNNAKTKQDIIVLIHPALISIIPTNQLDKIAQAILTKLLVEKQQAIPDRLDVPINYIYNSSDEKLTRIEIEDAIYDIAKE
jgi:hypothetical protein